jgi:hypothetical protein
MTTKQEMIDLLKTEFPTLQVGDEDNGYTELSAEDYEAQIAEWADVRLKKEAVVIETEAKALAKGELLTKLGITAEEAALLLS